MGGQASVRSGAGLGPGAFPGARRLCGPGQIRGWSCVPDSHVEALSLTMSLEPAWQAGRHVQPEAVRPRPVRDSALRACGGRAASCHKLRVYRALLPWDGSPLGWSLRVEAEECSLGHRCLLPPGQEGKSAWHLPPACRQERSALSSLVADACSSEGERQAPPAPGFPNTDAGGGASPLGRQACCRTGLGSERRARPRL